MRRVLKPGAPLALLDLVPHNEAWLREAQGDRLLGVDPADVLAALERHRVEHVALETPSDHYRPARPGEAGEAGESGESGETGDSGQTGAAPEPEQAHVRARLPLFLVRATAPA
jgi:hypothetical protein